MGIHQQHASKVRENQRNDTWKLGHVTGSPLALLIIEGNQNDRVFSFKLLANVKQTRE